jgi:hypothetical protein
MSKVKIYKYKMLYNPGTDYEKVAKRMGTRSYIETLKGCSIIEKSELEVDSSKVDTVTCTRFRRHRVRCLNGTGGGSWRDGSLHASSNLRLCG